MKKIYVVLTVLAIVTANLFAIDSARINDSNNWLDDHPALLAVDGQPNSYAQLQAGQNSGWIAVKLEQAQSVMGFRIDAAIPEGSWLSLAYDDNGVMKRIPTSYVTEVNSESTVMFQEEDIVADSLSIMLDGPNVQI